MYSCWGDKARSRAVAKKMVLRSWQSSFSLSFPWLSFLEIQSLIDICDINLYIDAVDLNHLPRTIMTIVPGSNILIVTLPYFYIWRKLTHQHYFLHSWTSLVGFELHAAIAGLSAGRQHFNNNSWCFNQCILWAPISGITGNSRVGIDILLLAVFFRSQKHLHIHAKGSTWSRSKLTVQGV